MGDYPQVSRAGTQSESTTITNRERERDRSVGRAGTMTKIHHQMTLNAAQG